MTREDALEILNGCKSWITEDRLYIKIYADDEPSVKAEKPYQICGETQNREVAEWLKEYFPLDKSGWILCSERLPNEKEMVLCSFTDWQTGETEIDVAYRSDWNLWHKNGLCQRYNPKCVAWMPLPKPYKGGDKE